MQPVVRDQREVWVVHGRNEKVRAGMFNFLRTIGLKPLEWNQAVNEAAKATRRGSPHISEILEVAFSRNRAVVVLMTPDDEARLREPFKNASDPTQEVQLTWQARPNVIFEAGMALGKCEDRTILVQVGNLRPISDLAGRYLIMWDGSVGKRQELAERLRTVGCTVETSGTEWLTQSYFDVEPDQVIPSSIGEEASGRQSSPVPKTLTERQYAILLEISREPDEKDGEQYLADHFSMSISEARYNLEELAEMGLARIISFNRMTGDRTWGLTQEGRAYVFRGQS